MHKIPNVVHQRCGEVWRQSFTDVYSRMCAVRNHASDINVPRRVNLEIISANRPAIVIAGRDAPRV